MLRLVQPAGKCWTARCWSVRKRSTFMPAIPFAGGAGRGVASAAAVAARPPSNSPGVATAAAFSRSPRVMPSFSESPADVSICVPFVPPGLGGASARGRGNRRMDPLRCGSPTAPRGAAGATESSDARGAPARQLSGGCAVACATVAHHGEPTLARAAPVQIIGLSELACSCTEAARTLRHLQRFEELWSATGGRLPSPDPLKHLARSADTLGCARA